MVVSVLAVLAGDAVIADCDVDASNLPLIMGPRVISSEDVAGGELASIDYARCTSCGLCEVTCQFGAIDELQVLPVLCNGCGACELVCPEGAISMVRRRAGTMFVASTDYGDLVYAEMEPGQTGTGRLITSIRNRAYDIASREGKGLVIADGSPGIGCSVIASITGADLVLVVVEPTKSALHDMERAIEVSSHFGIETLVCINKDGINRSISGRIESFCREVSVPVVGRIAYDEDVMSSMASGRPPTSGKAFDEIAEIWPQLLERMGVKRKCSG